MNKEESKETYEKYLSHMIGEVIDISNMVESNTDSFLRTLCALEILDVEQLQVLLNHYDNLLEEQDNDLHNIDKISGDYEDLPW
jgi:hypothetical protein